MIHPSLPPRVLLVCSLLALVACGGSASAPGAGTAGGEAGERHPIVLGRPAVPGSRFHIENEVTSRQQQVTSMGGRTLNSIDATTVTRIAATYEILEVSANAEVTHARYRLESLVVETEGGVSAVLQPGQVVEVWPAADRADARVTIDGATASPELREAIDPVVKLSFSTRNDDALFGSTRPRAVGETWTPDLRAIADDLASHAPFRLDPGAMSGTVRVAEHRRVGGFDGLAIEVALTADRAELLGMPEGAVVREGRLELRLDGFFPDDTSLPRLTESTQMELRVAMEVPSEGGRVDLQMTMTMSGHGSSVPLL